MEIFDGAVRPIRFYACFALAQALVATVVVAALSQAFYSVGITVALCLVVLGIQWRVLMGSPTAHAILLVLHTYGLANGLHDLTSRSSEADAWFSALMVAVNTASLSLLVQRSSLRFTFGSGDRARTSTDRTEEDGAVLRPP